MNCSFIHYLMLRQCDHHSIDGPIAAHMPRAPRALPAEIWIAIMLISPATYYALIRTCKRFHVPNAVAKSAMTSMIELPDRVAYQLPNRWIHRDGDKPAVVYADGSQCWCSDGKYHRDNNLPAVILADGSQYWYTNGKQHRIYDEPAETHIDGSQFWYIGGMRHRDNDKPAEIYADGTQCWCTNGKRHRADGEPAIIHGNGNRQWFTDGKLCRTDRAHVAICADGAVLTL